MDGSIPPFQLQFPEITIKSRAPPPPPSLGDKFEPPDEYKNMNIEDIYLEIGERMHFIQSLSEDDPYKEVCKTFVGAYYRHLVTKSFLLLPGKPGVGKSSFAKEIASMIVSKGGTGAEGYFYLMSNQQLLTVDRLYGYSMGSQYFPGPLGEMIKDANEKPQSTFVLIVDEYNRGSDPVLLFAKVWDAKLDRAGPNERAGRCKYRRVSKPNEAGQTLPVNIKFIFTGNRQEDGCAGEVIEEDSALRLNRFAGSEVAFPDQTGPFSFEKNGYPGNVIVENMTNRLISVGYKGYAYSETEIKEIIKKVEQGSADCDQGEKLMPGKIVSLVYEELDAKILIRAAAGGLDGGDGMGSGRCGEAGPTELHTNKENASLGDLRDQIEILESGKSSTEQSEARLEDISGAIIDEEETPDETTFTQPEQVSKARLQWIRDYGGLNKCYSHDKGTSDQDSQALKFVLWVFTLLLILNEECGKKQLLLSGKLRQTVDFPYESIRRGKYKNVFCQMFQQIKSKLIERESTEDYEGDDVYILMPTKKSSKVDFHLRINEERKKRNDTHPPCLGERFNNSDVGKALRQQRRSVETVASLPQVEAFGFWLMARVDSQRMHDMTRVRNLLELQSFLPRQKQLCS